MLLSQRRYCQPVIFRFFVLLCFYCLYIFLLSLTHSNINLFFCSEKKKFSHLKYCRPCHVAKKNLTFLQQGTSYSTEQVYPLEYCLLLFLYLDYGYKKKVRFELYIPFCSGLLIIQCGLFLGNCTFFSPQKRERILTMFFQSSKLFT